MKIMTILGTRPEIIRLCLIIKKLDKLCNHTLVYTGQNYHPKLKDIFFKELEVRQPDYSINSKADTFGKQISIIFQEIERILLEVKPDRVLILGDTNTDLSAIIAERMGIPVYHLEAGNRCYDPKVPEEKNRRIIDSISTYNMPYTPNSCNNLIKEGIPREKIFITGNPINEVMQHFNEKISNSPIAHTLKLLPAPYALVTAHRAENVDVEPRLRNIITALNTLANDMPVILSCHPRTQSKLIKFRINTHVNLRINEPFGFFDFIKLEKLASIIITDSGTVQEEACILNIPAVIIRDTTERPETCEVGASMISGLEDKSILRCISIMMNHKREWKQPIGYSDTDVSEKVIKFILGK